MNQVRYRAPCNVQRALLPWMGAVRLAAILTTSTFATVFRWGSQISQHVIPVSNAKSTKKKKNISMYHTTTVFCSRLRQIPYMQHAVGDQVGGREARWRTIRNSYISATSSAFAPSAEPPLPWNRDACGLPANSGNSVWKTPQKRRFFYHGYVEVDF